MKKKQQQQKLAVLTDTKKKKKPLRYYIEHFHMQNSAGQHKKTKTKKNSRQETIETQGCKKKNQQANFNIVHTVKPPIRQDRQ